MNLLSFFSMKMKINKFLQIVCIVLFCLFILSSSLPLSTKGRWIVDDETGNRVKLRCGNWPLHLKPMLAEGLDKQQLPKLVSQLSKYKFNCVRLTWPIYLITRYANNSVAQTFDTLGLNKSKEGIAKHNPSFLKMTHIEAFKAVVNELDRQGIMIDIDNHISKPGWCCGYNDKNGFPGDEEFDPQEWLKGLGIVAKLFKHKSRVVAMSLRNEPRGKRENWPDWIKYVTEGVNTIHKENKKLLIIVSGLNYASDLRYLKTHPLKLNFTNKIVYEAHWYAFSGVFGGKWNKEPTNRICGKATQWYHGQNGFVMEGKNAAPLFMSEFGYDERRINRNDNLYMNCILAYLAEKDLDWALWAFQGSYYFRQGHLDLDEAYGAMNHDWSSLRDPTLKQKFNLIQRMIQDPNSQRTKTYLIYHPKSGNCVIANNESTVVHLGDCESSQRWRYGGDGTPIELVDKSLYLKSIGDGKLATLSAGVLGKVTKWNSKSLSKLHLVTFGSNDQPLCLENYPNSTTIITNKCICIDDDPKCLDDPERQWFKLVPINV